MSIADGSTARKSQVVIAHACASHVTGGTFDILESHLFSVTINIPGLLLTVKPFYWPSEFIVMLLSDLEAFAKGQSEDIGWKLYPDDMENAIGFLRVQGKYTFHGHEAIDWQFELDGPRIERSWLLSFGFVATAKQLKGIRSELNAMLSQLKDPTYEWDGSPDLLEE